ncbi:MAG: hypothetical protein MK515_01265 [SAR324 cluster bacterium]|nr:hypothetical protein [SAR324 cluster bacterium]MCH2265081.1 hypothetical protein [SAR324 cluster bacterium]
MLNDFHQVGQSKSQYFQSVGFSVSRHFQLKAELLRLAKTGKVSSVIPNPHGVKYVVDGNIHSPQGKMIKLRSIWIIEIDQSFPRLVTAYPL